MSHINSISTIANSENKIFTGMTHCHTFFKFRIRKRLPNVVFVPIYYSRSVCALINYTQLPQPLSQSAINKYPLWPFRLLSKPDDDNSGL